MTGYQSNPEPVNASRYIRPYNFTRDVFVIPRCLARYTGIGIAAKMAWVAIASMSCGKNCAFPQVETLAAETGMSRDRIMDGIAELVKDGFLERKRRFQRSNLYFFLNHPIFHEFFSDEPDTVDDAPTPRRGSPTPATPAPPNEGGPIWDALIQYMGDTAPRPLNGEIVALIRKAAPAGTDDASIAEFITGMRERYRPGVGSGPKDWGWFLAIVKSRFKKQSKAPVEVADPNCNICFGIGWQSEVNQRCSCLSVPRGTLQRS